MPDIIEVQTKLGYLTGTINPIAKKLEEAIADTTNDLEIATTTLRALSERLNEEKTEYDEIKAVVPSFKSDLKPIASEKYTKLVEAITSPYNFSQIVSDTEDSIESLMAKTSKKLEDYKSQMNDEELEISRLSAQLKELQIKFNTQSALSEELKLAMSDNGLSKEKVFELLRKFINENGEPLFSEAEIVKACLLVMFGESLELEQKNGIPMAEVLSNAFGQADLEPVEAVVNNMELPVTEEAIVAKLEEIAPVFEEKQPVIEPIPMPVAEVIRKNNVIPFPTMAKEETFLEAPSYQGIEGLIDFDDPYSLIDEGYEQKEAEEQPQTSIVSHTSEEEARYEANKKKLQTLGLKGDIARFPITFYNVTPEYIEEMIEVANSYGVKLKTIGDVAKLCSAKNVQTYLDEALEKNPEGLGTKSLQNVIYAADKFGKGLKSTNFALKTYLNNSPVLKALEDTKEDVNLGNVGYINLINLQGMLKDVLEENAYAYIVNGKSFSKKRVERILTRLLASDVKATDEELLLIALTYDSQLGSPDEIATVDNELHARLNTDKGKTLGGMAA